MGKRNGVGKEREGCVGDSEYIFCNRVWKGERWPEGWKEGEIVPM